MENTKIKAKVSYNGHNANSAGIINLNLIFSYEELTNAIQLIPLLTNNIQIFTKDGKETNKLGIFTIKNISINNNGEAKVKFSSLLDSVNLDYINNIIDKDIIKALFVCDEISETENDENLPF